MALFWDQGNSFTLAPGAIAYINWVYVDGLDHGPQYVSALFQGVPDNNGTATTIQTSVIVFYVQTVAYYLYAAQIRTDGASAFAMKVKVNIGNFK